jgi:RimJ/RimL family protein N-acetyltransferase
MIAVRKAETAADLDAWIRVRRAVAPNESAWTVAQFRERVKAERLVLVAELDGTIAGAGLGDRSDTAGRAFVAARVLPGVRRRGVGTTLLRELGVHALSLDVREAVAHVDGHDGGSVAFARRFGFEEVDRQVEQVRVLGGEPEPPPRPDGVEVFTIAQRPELLAEAYELALQGFADMATDRPATVSHDDWIEEEATLPEGSFVALADGEIVAYCGLCGHDNHGVAEDGLTVVRRDWRRRGLATALKRRELAWAAEQGLREVVTWTQDGNEGMRRVNQSLGYVTRDVSLTMAAALPLKI